MTARYITGDVNHCPGCNRSQWIIGRVSAECAFCSTALPLADQPASQPRPMLKLGKGGGKVSRMMPVMVMA
jgi:hypothetical protein